MPDKLGEIMAALAKGPRPTEADIEKLVDWARRARTRAAELEADKQAMIDDRRRIENASNCPGDVDLLDHVEYQALLVAELRAKLDIWEGGIQGDALEALNEAPGLKARAETAESRVTRLKALVAATAALDSDLETIIRLGDRVLEQTERAETAEARVEAFESAARIVTEPDGTIPVQEQADACVDALSVLMETSSTNH